MQFFENSSRDIFKIAFVSIFAFHMIPIFQWLQLKISIKRNIYSSIFKKNNYNWESALKEIYIYLLSEIVTIIENLYYKKYISTFFKRSNYNWKSTLRRIYIYPSSKKVATCIKENISTFF